MSGFMTKAPAGYTPPTQQQMLAEAGKTGLAEFDDRLIEDLCNLAEGGQILPVSALEEKVRESAAQRTAVSGREVDPKAIEAELAYHRGMREFASQINLSRFPGTNSLERAVSMLKFRSMVAPDHRGFENELGAREQANLLNDALKTANSLDSAERKLLYEGKRPQAEVPTPSTPKMASPQFESQPEAPVPPGAKVASSSQAVEQPKEPKAIEGNDEAEKKLGLVERVWKWIKELFSKPQSGSKSQQQEQQQPQEQPQQQQPQKEENPQEGSQQQKPQEGSQQQQGQSKGSQPQPGQQSGEHAGQEQQPEAGQGANADPRTAANGEGSKQEPQLKLDGEGADQGPEPKADGQGSESVKPEPQPKPDGEGADQGPEPKADGQGSTSVKPEPQPKPDGEGAEKVPEPTVDGQSSEAARPEPQPKPDGKVPEPGAEPKPDGKVPEPGAEPKPDGKVPEPGAEPTADGKVPEPGAEPTADGKVPEPGAEPTADGKSGPDDQQLGESQTKPDELEADRSQQAANSESGGKTGTLTGFQLERPNLDMSPDWLMRRAAARFENLRVAKDLMAGADMRYVLDASRVLDKHQLHVCKEEKMVPDPTGEQVRRRPIRDLSELGKLSGQDLAMRTRQPTLFYYKAVSSKFLIREKMKSITRKQCIFLLVDGSGSMAGLRHQKASGFVLNRLKSVMSGDAEVWLSVFDVEMKNLMHASTEEEAVIAMKAFREASFTGGSNANGDVVLAAHLRILDLVEKQNMIRPEIWLLTDNDTTISTITPEMVAGTKVYGLAFQADNSALRKFCEGTGGLCWENV